MRRPIVSSSRSVRFHLLVFDDPETTLDAVRALRRRGFDIDDVYTPFAVHGLDDALGLAPTRVPRATLLGGAAGAVIGLAFQVWTGAFDWPLNIGGKSDVALPALLPVTFEVGVLLAALSTVAALVWASRLAPGRRSDSDLAGVTDDRFAVVVRESDASFHAGQLDEVAAASGVVDRRDSWRVS